MGGPIYLFTARSIRVFAEPWYLFLALYMASAASSWTDGILWVLCVTASIIVHEFGHGLMALYYRLQPSIVLHGWGGMTLHAPAKRDRDDALIVAAGPAAGLLFGLVVFAASFIAELAVPGVIASRPILNEIVENLLYVNIFWSFVNLVPMFPLDGGLLFRLGAYKLLRPVPAERLVHGVGFALALAWAAVGWGLLDSFFMLVMGVMFAWENFAVLSGRKSAPKARTTSPRVTGLLQEARQAWASGDARETARLCHMLRSGGELPPQVTEETFALLVVATAAMGDHAEALSWARYAPVTGRVVEARLTSLLALGRAGEARELLAQHGRLLVSASRAEFERKLASAG